MSTPGTGSYAPHGGRIPYGGPAHGGSHGGDGSAAAFPALGFDPAPGQLASVEGLGSQLRGVADDLGQTQRALSQLARPGSAWQGDAAQAFSGSLEELPDLLRRAGQSMGNAAAALTRWSHQLSGMQEQARAYEREAEAARQHLQAARNDPALDLARSPLTTQALRDPLSPEDETRLSQARARLDAAQTELDQVIARAQQLRGMHGETAAEVERALRNAADHAPSQGLLDWIGGAVDAAKSQVEATWQTVSDFVQEHADEIAWVGDVLSTVSGALGIAALALAATGVGAPLAAVLGIASLATGTVALGAQSVAKAGGADVSWGTIALGVGGLALGGTARIAARGVKAASAARNSYKTRGEWSAARQVLQGPMRRSRAVRDYSRVGNEALGIGGTAYSGVNNQYRELWDSDQWMGGKYEAGEHPARPPRRAVAGALKQTAEVPAGTG